MLTFLFLVDFRILKICKTQNLLYCTILLAKIGFAAQICI